MKAFPKACLAISSPTGQGRVRRERKAEEERRRRGGRKLEEIHDLCLSRIWSLKVFYLGTLTGNIQIIAHQRGGGKYRGYIWKINIYYDAFGEIGPFMVFYHDH